jgi:hypothetical protein
LKFFLDPIALDMMSMQRDRKILPVYEAYEMAWMIRDAAKKYKIDPKKMLLVGFGESRWDQSLDNPFQISQTWYRNEKLCEEAPVSKDVSVECAAFVLAGCKRRHGILSNTLRCWRGYHIEAEFILPKYCAWSQYIRYNRLSKKELADLCQEG